MTTPPLLVALAALLVAPQDAPPAQVAESQSPAPLVERLAGHPFFSKLPLQAAPGFPPVDLVLQEPYGARPGWEAQPSNRFGPWAREVVRQFEARFAEPFALRRDPAQAPASIVVLATEGDLHNYRRSPGGRRAYAFREASWDASVDAVVVAGASSARAVHLARFPGLHLVAWRELIAHAESAAGAQPPLWVHWGLPAYLAWHTGFGPDSLATRELDRSMLVDWYEADAGVRAHGGTLLRLRELVAAAESEDAVERVRANGSAAGFPLDEGRADYLAWCAAVLWTHYLDRGEDGRWHDGYGAYLAGGLRGDWSLEAFRGALQVDEVGMRALERGFRTWLQDELRVLGLVEAAPEPLLGPVEAEEVEQEPALPPLEPQADEVALGHGLALVLAREGDLDGAVARLEALLAADPEGAYAQRIARDLERARGFRELRAGLLARLAESGDLLRLERDGKRLNVRIASVEADGIRLRETRGGVDAIPFAELPSFPLAREMERDAGWLRLWPYALVDDERWQRLLDEGEPGASALRDDAAEWYPGALRLGEVARELIAVGAGELPGDAEAARALAVRMGALAREHADLAEVELRLPSLRARAAAALESGWSEEALGQGLAGALEPLGEGRARLTYTFDDAAQLADLEQLPAYPDERARDMPPLTRPSAFEVERGALKGAGSASWRLPIAFQAPLTVRLRLRVGQVPDGGNTVVYWALGACDDGEGNLLLLEDLGSLLAIDKPANMSLYTAVEAFQQLRHSPYEIELRHDGERVSSFVDDELQKELEVGTRTAGDVLFTAHSDTPLSFDELVVEGALDPERNRARWVERRLRELGLP